MPSLVLDKIWLVTDVELMPFINWAPCKEFLAQISHILWDSLPCVLLGPLLTVCFLFTLQISVQILLPQDLPSYLLKGRKQPFLMGVIVSHVTFVGVDSVCVDMIT